MLSTASIVSIRLRVIRRSKSKAFGWTVLSGMSKPVEFAAAFGVDHADALAFARREPFGPEQEVSVLPLPGLPYSATLRYACSLFAFTNFPMTASRL